MAKPIIFLMGPTASGKTDLAVALTKHLPIDLISVDSTQVYRGLDIGSAKPSAKELAETPQQLIDICDPTEVYSAGRFRSDALREITAAHEANRIPLLVGGTMLYFNVLIEGLSDSPPADLEIRKQIEEEAQISGWPAMHRQLADVDPDTAARLHPNHSQRISRALEVYRKSGISMSEWRRREAKQEQANFLDQYSVTQLAIAPRNRQTLHERIALRFDTMLDKGFEEEVRRLKARGDLHLDLPAMRAVGYRQMWDYLAGDIDYETMRERGVVATRQLAKRQFTWLRSWKSLQWIYTESENEQESLKKDEICQLALNSLRSVTI
ncbi:tRNA (adenosine(37)-N6)-dimethylallyltransferase MiaA [Aurantivibrio infirmus]